MKLSGLELLKKITFLDQIKKQNRKLDQNIDEKPKKYKKGLVLSGGGARGIAHLGAAKALYEAGHTFDVIIGTSMGAIVGCILADGHQPEDIIKMLTPSNFVSFIRPDLSTNGLMSLKGAGKALSDILQVKKIEDLSIPFIAVATNLTEGTTCYFDKGDIINAVSASASIPVIFPPVVIEDEQYIDGGVLNNLPVRFIRDECESVAGFYVNPKTLGLYNGHAKGLLHIADRAFHLCMHNNVIPEIELCDFYLEHDNLDKYSTFDFVKAEEIYNLGYENTQKALLKNGNQLFGHPDNSFSEKE